MSAAEQAGSRRGGWRRQSVALACAGATLLSALAWAAVTPPFHAPDEPSHFAYVQRLAETGTPPSPSEVSRPGWSSAQAAALRAVRFPSVRANPRGKPPWTVLDQQRADLELSHRLAQNDGGGADAASTYPPLYYSIESVGYLASDALGANVIEQLTVLRLISCLLTSLTTLFIFFFIRELLPGTLLAAPVGALSVGLLPYVGFIGSSVNNDVLMMTLSAALFWLLARSWRRGLTAGAAVWIVAVLVAGWATKPIFLGLVPGALLAIVFLLLRLRSSGGKSLTRPLAALIIAGGVACGLYLALSSGLWARSTQPPGSSALVSGSASGQAQKSLTGFLSYLWQYWLPRLPFMTDQVAEPYPLWETMFKGFIGRFGWLEYQFPAWLYDAVLVCWVGLLALIARALVVGRAALRSRAGELLVYATMTAGVAGLISLVGYQLRTEGASFEQARYLFPLLALFGALIGLAIRGAGQQLAPYLGIAIVIGTGALNIGGLLMTLGRFYA